MRITLKQGDNTRNIQIRLIQMAYYTQDIRNLEFIFFTYFHEWHWDNKMCNLSTGYGCTLYQFSLKSKGNRNSLKWSQRYIYTNGKTFPKNSILFKVKTSTIWYYFIFNLQCLTIVLLNLQNSLTYQNLI